MKPEDSRKLDTLAGEGNKAFKELRYDQYIKIVDKMDELIKPYR